MNHLNGKHVAAIILAGGRGSRMGARYKQFIDINGKAVITYSMGVLMRCKFISRVVVVLPKKHFLKFSHALKKKNKSPKLIFIKGGSTRRESSFSALKYLLKLPPKFVIFQDASRPLITQEMVHSVYENAKKWGAAVIGIMAVDTIGELKGKFMISAPDKKKIFHVHLPQCYEFNSIWEAHTASKGEDIDNSVLLSRLGKRIRIVFGHYPNTKLTHKEDIKIISSML